jgi:putative membrane-bound dehydrogenase-like protein
MKIDDRLLVLWMRAAVGLVLLSQTARGEDIPKAKFESPTVTSQTSGHAVEIDADISGAKQLYLVVTDADDSFACDWADWAEPRLVNSAGEKKLTELKWKSATSQWGHVHVDRNADGGAMRIDGKNVAYGIGTHANSLIAFDLPPGYTRFKARGGLDNGGTDQGHPSPSSVRFMVFTEPPPATLMAKLTGGSGQSGGIIDHDPAKATSYLDVADGLEVTLFASEPMMTNPSDIDIDAQGRVWVCDVQNYRGHNGLRPAGDRILILEDTKGEGKADKATTFYQGRDVDAALGVCVLGNRVIVSCTPNIFVFTGDGHDHAAKKEVLFKNPGLAQHDHGAHAFVFGPDGKLYWNFGNMGQRVHDKNDKPIVDLEGNEVDDRGRPYRQGMVFRCDRDGSRFEVLAHNFRNNYEVAVDSFGTLWQSDNDDDGNRGVRINCVMEHGNFGYTDEMTGASWNSGYLGQPEDIPSRHWHQSDPGVVPNLLHTGAGAPSGILVYEGDLLPEVFRNQMIHADPGVNIVRSYPVSADGAGYKARIVNILGSTRNQWFRPCDVCVAPDGSLFVADWYDPGVGGHAQGDTDRGRIFRIAPKGSKYTVPKFDFTTVEGAIQALKNPSLAVRYLAWTKLHDEGPAAEPALLKLFQSDNPRYRARALWLLSKIEGRGAKHIDAALADGSPDIRITALRAARELNLDIMPLVKKLVHDPSPQVRRECAIALRHCKSPDAADLWAELAMQHDGKDRWYLEALGIGADKQWDSFFGAWLAKASDNWTSAAGRDIVWRSRAKAAIPLLAKLILDPATKPEDRVRYFRAFDFQSDPAKQAVLIGLLGGDHPDQATISALALKQLHGARPTSPEFAAALAKTLDAMRGSDLFLELVITYQLRDRADDVLAMALADPAGTRGVKAARYLLQSGAGERFQKPLTADDITAEKAIDVLGLTQEPAAVDLILRLVQDPKRGQALRSAGIGALGHSRLGERAILKLAAGGQITVELQYAAAKALQASIDNGIRAEAAKYLKLPEPAGGKPLPPLAELLKRRGNVEHGKVVFNTAGTCAKCHTIGGVGKDVGPNLSEIGDKFPKDGLYESILFPSAAIAHNYETHRIELQSGNVVQGIITSETADSITIKTAEAIVQTYKKSEIADNSEIKISLMPADLQKLMTTDDLVDVVEYLTTCRKTGKTP